VVANVRLVNLDMAAQHGLTIGLSLTITTHHPSGSYRIVHTWVSAIDAT